MQIKRLFHPDLTLHTPGLGDSKKSRRARESSVNAVGVAILCSLVGLPIFFMGLPFTFICNISDVGK